MKRKKTEKRRWELEEPKKEIIVPTLKEKIKLGLTDEEWMLICYGKYQNSECFREANAQPLCNPCPKSGRAKIDQELEKKIAVLAKRTTKRVARIRSRRPYYRR